MNLQIFNIQSILVQICKIDVVLSICCLKWIRVLLCQKMLVQYRTSTTEVVLQVLLNVMLPSISRYSGVQT